jgi:hypothetical protein
MDQNPVLIGSAIVCERLKTAEDAFGSCWTSARQKNVHPAWKGCLGDAFLHFRTVLQSADQNQPAHGRLAHCFQSSADERFPCERSEKLVPSKPCTASSRHDNGGKTRPMSSDSLHCDSPPASETRGKLAAIASLTYRFR